MLINQSIDNPTTEILEDFLLNNPDLESLEISNPRFYYFETKLKLHNLRTLVISSGHYFHEGKVSINIDFCPNLNSLKLNSINISNEVNLEHLHTLSLYDFDIATYQYINAPKLKNLSLEGINGFNCDKLKEYKFLETLDVFMFASINLHGIDRLPELKYLYLNVSSIKRIDQLNSLKNLRYLFLYTHGGDRIEEFIIPYLTNIETIHLSLGNISKILNSSPTLKKLELDCYSLKELPDLSQFVQLEEILIENTQNLNSFNDLVFLSTDRQNRIPSEVQEKIKKEEAGVIFITKESYENSNSFGGLPRRNFDIIVRGDIMYRRYNIFLEAIDTKLCMIKFRIWTKEVILNIFFGIHYNLGTSRKTITIITASGIEIRDNETGKILFPMVKHPVQLKNWRISQFGDGLFYYNPMEEVYTSFIFDFHKKQVKWLNIPDIICIYPWSRDSTIILQKRGNSYYITFSLNRGELLSGISIELRNITIYMPSYEYTYFYLPSIKGDWIFLFIGSTLQMIFSSGQEIKAGAYDNERQDTIYKIPKFIDIKQSHQLLSKIKSIREIEPNSDINFKEEFYFEAFERKHTYEYIDSVDFKDSLYLGDTICKNRILFSINYLGQIKIHKIYYDIDRERYSDYDFKLKYDKIIKQYLPDIDSIDNLLLFNSRNNYKYLSKSVALLSEDIAVSINDFPNQHSCSTEKFTILNYFRGDCMGNLFCDIELFGTYYSDLYFSAFSHSDDNGNFVPPKNIGDSGEIHFENESLWFNNGEWKYSINGENLFTQNVPPNYNPVCFLASKTILCIDKEPDKFNRTNHLIAWVIERESPETNLSIE